MWFCDIYYLYIPLPLQPIQIPDLSVSHLKDSPVP